MTFCLSTLMSVSFRARRRRTVARPGVWHAVPREGNSRSLTKSRERGRVEYGTLRMSTAVPTHSKVWLKRGREKSLLRKHPWVFSGAIERVQGDAGAGDTVEIVDASGGFLAWAAYSPASQIRARVWSFEREETIGPGFLRGRLERAIESRRKLGLLGADAACRLVFAESDGLPG